MFTMVGRKHFPVDVEGAEERRLGLRMVSGGQMDAAEIGDADRLLEMSAGDAVVAAHRLRERGGGGPRSLVRKAISPELVLNERRPRVRGAEGLDLHLEGLPQQRHRGGVVALLSHDLRQNGHRRRGFGMPRAVPAGEDVQRFAVGGFGGVEPLARRGDRAGVEETWPAPGCPGPWTRRVRASASLLARSAS